MNGNDAARRSRIRDRSGFTLIELMVVISIMAILLALTVPLISNSTKKGKIAQANSEIAALSSALRAYYNAYSVWGTLLSEGGAVNDQIVRLLSGEDVDDQNRRRLVLMEFPDPARRGQGFLDPWDRPYRFAVDRRYDNTVEVDIGDTPILRQRIAVWSLGPPDEQAPITSW